MFNLIFISPFWQLPFELINMGMQLVKDLQGSFIIDIFKAFWNLFKVIGGPAVTILGTIWLAPKLTDLKEKKKEEDVINWKIENIKNNTVATLTDGEIWGKCGLYLEQLYPCIYYSNHQPDVLLDINDVIRKAFEKQVVVLNSTIDEYHDLAANESPNSPAQRLFKAHIFILQSIIPKLEECLNDDVREFAAYSEYVHDLDLREESDLNDRIDIRSRYNLNNIKDVTYILDIKGYSLSDSDVYEQAKPLFKLDACKNVYADIVQDISVKDYIELHEFDKPFKSNVESMFQDRVHRNKIYGDLEFRNKFTNGFELVQLNGKEYSKSVKKFKRDIYISLKKYEEDFIPDFEPGAWDDIANT